MTWTYIAPHHIAVCNLCGSGPSDWLTIAERDRAGFPARSVACQQCGLVFLTPRMTPQGYAEFYECGAYRDNVKRVLGREQKFEELVAGQGFYAQSLMPWLDGKLPGGNMRMLDIGGSTGVVAAELCKRYGYRGTVLDPSESELRHARGLGLGVEHGTLETWHDSTRRGELELVTLLQTVEHLMDIGGGLAKIRGLLAPDGLFLVDIVCIEHLFDKCRKVGSFAPACKIDHAYSLRDATMLSYLMRSGFKVIDRGVMDASRKKIIYLCSAGEALPMLPTEGDVAKFFRLIEEVGKCGSP